MKIWVVTCEYGFQYGYNHTEIDDTYLVGTYSNLPLAARAALDCFYTSDNEPLDRIVNIFNGLDNAHFNFFGRSGDNYTKVFIQRTTLNDF